MFSSPIFLLVISSLDFGGSVSSNDWGISGSFFGERALRKKSLPSYFPQNFAGGVDFLKLHKNGALIFFNLT